MDQLIKLYNEEGVQSKFYLQVLSSGECIVVKRVVDWTTKFSDKTKYRMIVIQDVKDPPNIVLSDNTHLYIDINDMRIRYVT